MSFCWHAHMYHIFLKSEWINVPLASVSSSSSLPQCLFRTSLWGRLSGAPLFRTSSCLTARHCPSRYRRPSRHASSLHPSTSSHHTGLTPTSQLNSVYGVVSYWIWWFFFFQTFSSVFLSLNKKTKTFIFYWWHKRLIAPSVLTKLLYTLLLSVTIKAFMKSSSNAPNDALSVTSVCYKVWFLHVLKLLPLHLSWLLYYYRKACDSLTPGISVIFWGQDERTEQ